MYVYLQGKLPMTYRLSMCVLLRLCSLLFWKDHFCQQNMVGFFTGKAYERNLAKSFFHHPFEVAAQITIYNEYIHSSLVICNKYIGLTGLQIFTTFYLYRQKQYVADYMRPYFSWPIPPKSARCQAYIRGSLLLM